jgi:hypothetical protein
MRRLRSLVISASCLPLATAAGSCRREPAAEPPPDVLVPPASLPPSPRSLPDEGFRVEWVANTMPRVVKAGSRTQVEVTVRNVGLAVWPDLKSSGGRPPGAIRIGYRWLSVPSGSPPSYASVRGNLPAPLPPGQSATLGLDVTAPATPGAYRIQFDLVQEFVAWFESKDATRLIIPVRVVEVRS